MQCGQCGYTCTRKDNLTRHENSKHGSVMFQCENCDFKSNRKDNLARHILNSHSESRKRKLEPEPHVTRKRCHYEDTDIFNSDDDMDVDEDTPHSPPTRHSPPTPHSPPTHHSPPPRHSCKDCGKSFATASNLYRHIRNHHEHNHLCEKCGKSFAKLESFSNHKCHVNEKVKARDNLDIDENVVGSSDETEEGNTSSAFNGLFNSQTWRIRNSTSHYEVYDPFINYKWSIQS